MRLSELIEALEDLRETEGDDCEVRLATQPSWPFECSIGEVQLVELDGGNVIYIAVDEQLGYLPGQAAEDLGWKK